MQAKQIANQIRYMCTSFKNRSGGSAAEWQCQTYMQEEMRRYADTVTEQEITVHPDAGWAWVVITAVCCLLSIIVPLLDMQSTALAAIALLCSAFAVAVTVFHFLMGFHMLDRFFPKRRAKNVMASTKPKGKVERRIVFTGHADAAYEFTYSHRGGAKKVTRVATLAFIGLAILFVLNLAFFAKHLVTGGIIVGSLWYWARVATLLLTPTFVQALFFFNTRCIVDGANDNLSGCAVAMAALKELSRRENRLSSTEVCCLITSSEECGLRGAHEFARQYEDGGLDTVFIVLDTLHDTEQLMVYTKGMNGFQKNSLEVAAMVQESALKMGLPMPEAGPYPGATDAEALSYAGLKACAICGVDHTPQPYYHTRADNIDSIDERCLGVSLELCLEIATLFDEQGADTDITLPEAV